MPSAQRHITESRRAGPSFSRHLNNDSEFTAL
jgi:hypothetical protein